MSGAFFALDRTTPGTSRHASACAASAGCALESAHVLSAFARGSGADWIRRTPIGRQGATDGGGVSFGGPPEAGGEPSRGGADSADSARAARGGGRRAVCAGGQPR